MSGKQNLPAVTSFNECQELAKFVAQSGLYSKWDTPAKVVVGMQLAIAEGKHPISAMQRYHIMDMGGKMSISKTASAMLTDFQEDGGLVEWHCVDKEKAEATFTPPNGKPLKLAFTRGDAIEAGIINKDVWKKWAPDMLSQRLITRVLRKIYPKATGLMYDQNEVQYGCPTSEEKPAEKNITPEKEMFEKKKLFPDEKTQPALEPAKAETPPVVEKPPVISEPEPAKTKEPPAEITQQMQDAEVTHDVAGNETEEVTFETKILELNEKKTLRYLRGIGWISKKQTVADLSDNHKAMIMKRFDSFKEQIGDSKDGKK